MKKTVILYCLTFSFFFGLCSIGQAHENDFSPDIFVAVKESDNLLDNSVDDSYLNTLLLPTDNYIHFNNDQFWNNLFDTLNKRMKEVENLFLKVDKTSIHNSNPISFIEKFIYPAKMDKKIEKSILKRIPRNAESSSVNTANTSVTLSSVHSDTSMNSSVSITTPKTTTEPQKTSNSIGVTVSNNVNLNLNDSKTVVNSNLTMQPTDSTITESTSLKLIENTTLPNSTSEKLEEKPTNSSNDINTLEKTSCDTPSNHNYCESCSLKMVFLFLGLMLGVGISIIVYIKQKGRGSRTFYHVRNICRKHEDSPV